MSEHKNNPRVALNETLPLLLPTGYRIVVDVQLQVVPKLNVLLVPPEKVRTTPEGVNEVLLGDPEEWRQPPDGVEVFELGKPLPPEKCDVIATLGTIVEDSLAPKLLTGGGSKQQRRFSAVLLGAFARAPLVEWQTAHLNALQKL